MIEVLLAVVLLSCTVGMGLLIWLTDRGWPSSPAEQAAVRAVRAQGTQPVTVAGQLEQLQAGRNEAPARTSMW